jgi:hypothetical protein
MVNEMAENKASAVPAQSAPFERFAGVCAVLAGIAGFLYAVAPTNPVILVPALLNGFLVNPALYTWLGLALLRGRSS